MGRAAPGGAFAFVLCRAMRMDAFWKRDSASMYALALGRCTLLVWPAAARIA
jgi:hypothetical protein